LHEKQLTLAENSHHERFLRRKTRAIADRILCGTQALRRRLHLALGAGYPETGSKNRSGLHWDMVCDLRKGGELYVDGELIQKNGRFLNKKFPQP